MFKRLLGTALIFGLASAAPPVASQAQQTQQQVPVDTSAPIPCAPRGALIEKLETGYHESRSGAGLKTQTQILEIWTSAETGTWTVLITRVDGSSCIVASGTNWLKDAPVVAGLGVRG